MSAQKYRRKLDEYMRLVTDLREEVEMLQTMLDRESESA